MWSGTEFASVKMPATTNPSGESASRVARSRTPARFGACRQHAEDSDQAGNREQPREDERGVEEGRVRPDADAADGGRERAGDSPLDPVDGLGGWNKQAEDNPRECQESGTGDRAQREEPAAMAINGDLHVRK